MPCAQQTTAVHSLLNDSSPLVVYYGVAGGRRRGMTRGSRTLSTIIFPSSSACAPSRSNSFFDPPPGDLIMCVHTRCRANARCPAHTRVTMRYNPSRVYSPSPLHCERLASVFFACRYTRKFTQKKMSLEDYKIALSERVYRAPEPEAAAPP